MPAQNRLFRLQNYKHFCNNQVVQENPQEMFPLGQQSICKSVKNVTLSLRHAVK